MIPVYYHAPDVSKGATDAWTRRSDERHVQLPVAGAAGADRIIRLRAIRRMTDEVLAALSPRFTRMYSDIGRPVDSARSSCCGRC